MVSLGQGRPVCFWLNQRVWGTKTIRILAVGSTLDLSLVFLKGNLYFLTRLALMASELFSSLRALCGSEWRTISSFLLFLPLCSLPLPHFLFFISYSSSLFLFLHLTFHLSFLKVCRLVGEGFKGLTLLSISHCASLGSRDEAPIKTEFLLHARVDALKKVCTKWVAGSFSMACGLCSINVC